MGAISKEAVNVPCSQTALKPTPSLCPDDSFNTLGWILGTEPFFTVSPLSLKSYFVSVIFIQSLNPVQLCDHGLQHARPPCPSPTPCPSVMPSNHLILCRPLLLLPSIFPSTRAFSNESVLCISGQRIGASASASVFPKSIKVFLQMKSFINCRWLRSDRSLISFPEPTP